MRSKTLRLFSSTLLIGLLLAPLARAQSADPGALNLTTSPLPINLTAKPGETVTTDLRVKNSGTKTEFLKVGLMKFTAFGEEGKPQLKEREAGDDYFDWVSFSQNQFQAEPNEWKTITMTIKVPKEAAFGYYYAVTFARANPGEKNDQQQSVEGGTATLVLLEVDSPNAKRELKLTGFTATKKIYEFLPATFKIKLQNTGNVHVVPSGTIFITKGGKQIDTVPINISRGNILPDSTRIFSVDWSSGFPSYEPKEADGKTVLKDGQVQYSLNWNVSKVKNLRFGKYTAHVTVVYDNGQRDVPLDATLDFWVIPWRLIAIFIGIPLLMIGVIVYLLISRRRYKKKAYGMVRRSK